MAGGALYVKGKRRAVDIDIIGYTWRIAQFRLSTATPPLIFPLRLWNMAGKLMNAVQYSAYGGGPEGLQAIILLHFPWFSIIYFVFHTLLPEVLETVVFFYNLLVTDKDDEVLN